MSGGCAVRRIRFGRLANGVATGGSTGQSAVTRSEVNPGSGVPDAVKVIVHPPTGGPVSPMTLLASGIPLSLLLDLVCAPDSADLLVNEKPATPRTAG